MGQYTSETITLFSPCGRRKYLTAEERDRFLSAAAADAIEVDLFCQTLALTGCRLSEALALRVEHIDVAVGVVTFETLKRRSLSPIHRQVPVPRHLLIALVDLGRRHPTGRLWTWHRQTAWRRVSVVMTASGVTGPQAISRGLRHGFAIHALQNGVPLNLVQKWLGHAHISTTAIYANATGPEERAFAERLWGQRTPL